MDPPLTATSAHELNLMNLIFHRHEGRKQQKSEEEEEVKRRGEEDSFCWFKCAHVEVILHRLGGSLGNCTISRVDHLNHSRVILA